MKQNTNFTVCEPKRDEKLVCSYAVMAFWTIGQLDNWTIGLLDLVQSNSKFYWTIGLISSSIQSSLL